MADIYLRTWALDDIYISRSHGSDGREVTAYAAIFDAPYEVQDQYGHYMETIERSAFNRTLKNGLDRVACLWNHGMDIHGKPDTLASVPLGSPVEIKPDHKGLLTVTRYNKSALADAALEAVRNGDVRSQSFRGKVYRSNPMRPPRVKAGAALPVVVRSELGLSDYGPTVTPVNNTDMVLAVRSIDQLAQDFADLDEAARAELIRALSSTTPLVPETTTATSTTEPGAEDPHPVHSGRLAIARARMALDRIKMGATRDG